MVKQALEVESKRGVELQKCIKKHFSSFLVCDHFVQFFYYKFFIRIYSLYRGGFIVTIPIRLILYINYIALAEIYRCLVPVSA
jgi:hypothetical protein